MGKAIESEMNSLKQEKKKLEKDVENVKYFDSILIES